MEKTMTSVTTSNPLKILPKFRLNTRENNASQFIEHWNTVFNQKVFQMPHLATRTLHTAIGLILRDVKFHYRGGCSDLRDSTIVQQDSGTGKKPAIEFVEEIARHLGFSVRRRSSITSAGAIGTLFEKKGEILETQGDLRVFDLITCSEADSILYTPMDKFGNDLLTNLCESQDPNNVISKRLARGEITPFTSKSSLFLTTTIPTKINLRWFEKGLYQRFGVSIKSIELSVYQGVRDEITDTLGKKVEVSTNIKHLAETLKSKVVPKEFEFSETAKSEIYEKTHRLDQILIELRNPQILELTKSFTIRRDLKMITYACHHAFLDNRKEINSQDVNYGFEVSLQSWIDLLNFVGRKTSRVESCSDAVLKLMNDGKIRSTSEIAEALDQFKAGNISYTLSTLTSKGLLNKLERNQYQK